MWTTDFSFLKGPDLVELVNVHILEESNVEQSAVAGRTIKFAVALDQPIVAVKLPCRGILPYRNTEIHRCKAWRQNRPPLRALQASFSTEKREISQISIFAKKFSLKIPENQVIFLGN